MITSFFSPKTSKKSKKNTESNSVELQNPQKKRVKTVHAPLTTTTQSIESASSILQSKPLDYSNFDSIEVKELLSHLNHQDFATTSENPDDETCDNNSDWHQKLIPRLKRNGSWFHNLAKFIDQERKNHTIYPPPHEVFSCLNLTPLSKLKVVIVGQDPYHGPNQGHGLCFSVRKGVPIPPSLRNIYKELQNDDRVSFGPSTRIKNNPKTSSYPNHGFLERWARQGVLLLNSVLTVRKGVANSHAKKGWENFTDIVIELLHEEYTSSKNDDDKLRDRKKKGLVFLLWGKPASKKAERILSRPSGRNHTVICTSHPSPLGANKTNSPFLGSKCFSRANDALIERGLDPIDWNVDGELNASV